MSMQTYQGIDRQGNQWRLNAHYGAYQESYTYDPNGNILNLTRMGADHDVCTQQLIGCKYMDILQYNYIPNTNQLEYITDEVHGKCYSKDKNGVEDIDDQKEGNYRYYATPLKSDIKNTKFKI